MAKLKTERSGKGANIRAEREYAKMIGVKSPTTLTKAQLDEAVRQREIELGIIKERHNLYDYAPFERASLAPQAETSATIKLYSGYFMPFPEGDGALRRDPYKNTPETDAYVSLYLAKTYNLKKGDRVSGTALRAECNRVRVMKKIRYVNEDTLKYPILRFEDIPTIVPSKRIRMSGNNALIGVIQDIVGLVCGQSLCIKGVDDNNETIGYSIAEVLNGLCTTFNGEVFAIIENMPEKANAILSQIVNPETTIVNGDRKEYSMLLELAKRVVERGENAVIVAYAPTVDLTWLTSQARATENASLTVIAVGQSLSSDAELTFSGEKILAQSIIRSKGVKTERENKVMKIIKNLCDGTPDELLSAFTEKNA
ncbi:MAG: hypothetical protein IKM44_00295 [Clostridia bacterium]|nr:hypothetical protein [Clostridia bacterium]